MSRADWLNLLALNYVYLSCIPYNTDSNFKLVLSFSSIALVTSLALVKGLSVSQTDYHMINCFTIIRQI